MAGHSFVEDSRSDQSFLRSIIEQTDSKNVTLETLDEIEQLQNIEIGFAKIDIEGYDCYALKGFENLIRKNKDNIVIVFEFWSKYHLDIKSINYYVYIVTKLMHELDFGIYEMEEIEYDENQKQFEGNRGVRLIEFDIQEMYTRNEWFDLVLATPQAINRYQIQISNQNQ